MSRLLSMGRRPGARCDAVALTMPAASRLPCGARVSRGLAELASLKQLRALVRETLRSSAAQRGRPHRTAYRALCRAFSAAALSQREREQNRDGR